MDLGLTEEQQMLRDFARDFLEKECTEQYVRDMEEDPTGYSAGGLEQDGRAGLDGPDGAGAVRRRRHGLPRPHGADRGVRARHRPRPLRPDCDRRRSPCWRPRARSRSRRCCPASPPATRSGPWRSRSPPPASTPTACSSRRRVTATPTSSTARSSSSRTATSPTTWSWSCAAHQDGGGRGRHLAVLRRREGARHQARAPGDDRRGQPERGAVRQRARAGGPACSAPRARAGRPSSASPARPPCSSRSTSSGWRSRRSRSPWTTRRNASSSA